MKPVTASREDLEHPRSVSAFRTARLLVATYLTISLLTVVAVVLLRNNAAMVTDAVWVRSVIVAASGLLTLSFTVRAARGSRRAFLRLRLTTGIMLVAIVVIASLPGAFPVWLRIEQAVCGLVLLGVVLIVNGRHLRSLFARA
ncbi:hypothetical protein QRX50_00425 [Amycolatopsis carbonis]|uniref:Uncharacterized protein n=1 Tax=Amycolatopsis carbonis TaxID=715471 RepID=A0A9Y2IG52_9PSEU|nr:hypothetical protein [Amycolatopsis sp. 2-15]WIX79319.1 hypothetical protein QRX50_00425 [Amycolatopsis sp. 2-15]